MVYDKEDAIVYSTVTLHLFLTTVQVFIYLFYYMDAGSFLVMHIDKEIHTLIIRGIN